MLLRCCGSGRRSLDFVRENIAPLPSYSYITNEFSSFHVCPGFNNAALAYLAKKFASKQPYFRLCGLIMDEVKTTNVGQIDKKLDIVVGPGSQVSFAYVLTE